MRHEGERISAYLDGELHGSELADLLTHLRGCGRCARDLEELHAVRSAVRALPIVEVPAELAIGDGEDGVVPITRRKGLWAGAAAALLAAVVAVAALLTPEPPTLTVEDLSSRFGARATLDPAFGPTKVVVPEVRQSE